MYNISRTTKIEERVPKRAENDPIKMGEHILENSASEKYLGDKIHEDGTAPSITETINGTMPAAIAIKKNYKHL